MSSQVATRTIEALRATLVQVEQQTGLAPDDPSLDTLKRILLQRIAELEAVAYSEEPEPADRTVTGTALELAVGPGEQEPARTLGINLAVSLLAGQATAQPSEIPSLRPEIPELPPIAERAMPELPDVREEGTSAKVG
jgi:hypothetical protein